MEPLSSLIDTNILLRLVNPQVPGHRVCAKAVDRLRNSGYTLCFTLQNATEFRNVSTRPLERNGHGMSLHATDLALDWIEGAMILLPDNEGVYEEWRRLVTLHGVRGVQVHDARLAASMIVHDVPQILTLNVADFARFSQIRAVHPASLLQ
jgi:predicted nucleic acid-binding protein